MSDTATVLKELEVHAPALAGLVQGRPSLIDEEMLTSPDLAWSRAYFDDVLSDLGGEELTHTLRILRHRTLIRVALREFRRLADIEETSRELAELAGAALDAALREARSEARTRFGQEPLDVNGQPIPFVIFGMGKLGGGELNPGSDIDICFFYGTDESSTDIEPHRFFTDVARRITRLIGDVTEDGFVFRVDLRLRPEGSQGSLVGSLLSAEHYYETFGRPWERAAWLRARPVAGDYQLGSQLLRSLNPFVFPRRVDPQIADVMHRMVVRSRAELSRTPKRDIKLGPGGIREAEFFVQTLQLIWGGVHPELRVPGTLEGLRRLDAAGLIRSRERTDLEAAWSMLRRIEHRIHMTQGYQTHDLPESRRFARSLGFDTMDALMERLDAHRVKVSNLFGSLRGDDHDHIAGPIQLLVDRYTKNQSMDAKEVEQVLGVRDGDEAHAHLLRWRKPDLPLGSRRIRRSTELAQVLLDEVRGAADRDLALRSLTAFLQRGGAAYGAMLFETPRLRRRLVGLLGASPTLGQALIAEPAGLDRLLTGALPTEESIVADHSSSPCTDDEAVEFLRPRLRRWTLAIALGLIDCQYDLDGASRLLSSLADAQISVAVDALDIDRDFAVVALGKLGSEELAFDGDLDLLFIHDGQSAERSARSARQIVRILSRIDASGPGYTVDTRLRPSGNQGTLVTTLHAFERYHATRAEDWERQALVRGRVIAGTSAVFSNRVERLLEHLAFENGAPNPVRVCELRRRMEREIGDEAKGRYHPKVGFGTLVDIEFLAQCMQMDTGLRRQRSGKTSRVRHTDLALASLEGSGLSADDAAHLRRSRGFFREIEYARRFLDPKGDGRIHLEGPRARSIARFLGVQSRDEERPLEVLRRSWQTHAEQNRARFEAYFGSVGTNAPWLDARKG